jgi:RNA-directed DNA polymerase
VADLVLVDLHCQRVVVIQAKLHRWARDDPHRRFDDVFNLVADPGFLLVAWDRVGTTRAPRLLAWMGAVLTPCKRLGVEEFLGWLRASLKDRIFRPVPVYVAASRLPSLIFTVMHLVR